jgi:hypothetical protein
VDERDYFQSYVPPESGVFHFARQIRVDATAALLGAIARHPRGERLRRAASQYGVALDSWRLGRETLSLAHLWMALEALTKVKVEAERAARGLASREELAEVLGVPPRDLEPTVRRTLLLNGDAECYTKAKKASDGFEHGFLDFRDIHPLAQDVRHRMAEYVRGAIFELCVLDDAVTEILTKEPFDKPLGYWPPARYVWGRLRGSNPQLAVEGKAYPFLLWEPRVEECRVGEDGKIHVRFSETYTPELGEGISFEDGRHEVWEPS